MSERHNSRADSPAVAQSETYIPYQDASFLSKLFFTWVNPLLLLAKIRTLNQRDLGNVPPRYRCEILTEQFDSLWREIPGKWTKIIWKFNSKRLALAFILIAFSDFLSWGVRLLLQHLIQYLEDVSQRSNTEGKFPSYSHMLTAGFFLLTLLRGILEGSGSAHLQAFGTKLKTGMMGTLYKKAQRFSYGSKEKYSGGIGINVLSVDTNRVLNFVSTMNKGWLVPFRIIMSFIMGFATVGMAAFPGAILVLLTIPLLLIISNRMKKFKVELSFISDSRLRSTQESLQGIKILKYLAWEEIASAKIHKLREKELRLLKQYNSLYGLALALTFWVPIFASTISIATMATMEPALQASKVVAVILAFQALVAPLRDLPSYISNYVSARTAMNRIADYLQAPEALDTFCHDIPSNVAVYIEGADMVWEAAPPDSKVRRLKRKRKRTLDLPQDSTITPQETFVLRDINLKIPKGSLVAIIGSIGSGKSSLLESLMGSLIVSNGKINLPHCSIGYCEQQAWIFNSSIRNNIVFGRPFDELLYQRVITECSLDQDLEALPYADETIIGEKGSTISGGQKQRIGLARVFYAQPDLVLLDDPFSAVDASVGKRLFFSIKNGLLKDTTRIVATHNRAILDDVDYIVVMERGKIKAQGTFKELMASTDPRLAAVRDILVKSKLYEEESLSEEEELDEEKAEPSSSEESSDSSDEEEVKVPRPRFKPIKVKKVEEKISRHASPETYKEYIKGFGGIYAVAFIAFLIIMTEIIRVGKDLYMKGRMDTKSMDNDSLNFLTLYSGMGVLQGLFSLAANVLCVFCCTAASRFIHVACIEGVLSVRLAVFDVTPIGRILNRFSRDLEIIDNNFPDKLTFLVTCLSTMLSALIMILWTQPKISLTFIVPVIAALYVQKLFGRAWRQLQQLQGQALGPVVALFSESLSGLSTIKALGATTMFTKKFRKHVDRFGSSSLWFLGVRRWLGLRSELIANSYVTLLTFILIQLETAHQIIGLLIAYMVNAADCIDWAMKTFSEVDSCFVSVERIHKYIQDLEKEELSTLDIDDQQWPSAGRVVFDRVTIRYRPDLPPALAHLSFSLKPGEKVGIVGRTGAGKSSIITCIFRFVELSEGRILIDDRDILQLPTKQLRRALAMVPQDPILFSGTLRSNLDPQGQYPDAEIWSALENTYMREFVACHPEKLDLDVGDRGSMFSIGQKQLLCLARAMIRRSKIIIMDEATSSIDRDTDALIQQSLRVCFQDATVITIAHRLETIMEYDRVIVMADGEIIEIGNPKVLAAGVGCFADMAAASGISVDPL